MSISYILSDIIGMPEPPLRMLVAVLSAYPFAFLYHWLKLWRKQSPALLHLFSIITGSWMVHYLSGTFAVHFLLDVILVYIVLKRWPGTRLSLALTWMICGTHTLIGYANQCRIGSVHNPLNWTIPQCVLLMKLVGLSTDLYDGSKKQQEDDKQSPNAITHLPQFLEFAGFSCFFGNVLVGPQFSFKRYISYISGSLYDVEKTQSSFTPGLKRLLTGLVYVSSYGILGRIFQAKYLVSDEFANLPLVYQLLYLMIWGRIYLWMYVSIWILVEGACIFTGISYDGVDEDGKPKWGALSNVHVLKFEFSYTLQGVIDTFNITSSRWTYQYVFKRLKWLKLKSLSHMVTLMFLAMWHGLWPGYFINFMLEFILIMQERQMLSWLKRMTGYQSVNDLPLTLSAPLVLLAQLLKSIIIAFPLASFALLKWEDCWKFMVAVKFYLFIGILSWAVFYVVVVKNMKNQRRPEKPQIRSTNEDNEKVIYKTHTNGHVKLLAEE